MQRHAWPAASSHRRRLQALGGTLALALGLSLTPLPLGAVPSTGGGERPPDDTIKLRELEPGILPVMKGETRFTGTVMDRDRRPLQGIQVRLFVSGLLVRSVATDAVGQYTFKQAINHTGKETVALWFVDEAGRLTPKALILAESPAAAEAKLLSPCFARIQFEPVVESKVHLFDKDTRAQQVLNLDCL